MSWFINSIGTTKAVASDITINASLSPKLKDALLEICGEPPYGSSKNDAIAIEGSGHAGEGSYINSLKVTRFSLAREPATPATS